MRLQWQPQVPDELKKLVNRMPALAQYHAYLAHGLDTCEHLVRGILLKDGVQ